jgi:hypothetical protein
MSDKTDWLDAIAREDRKDLRDEKKPEAFKKTVWALVSIEVDVEEGEAGYDDDEALMDIIHDELVQYGFTIDDMGMMNPTDLDKFYPETEETK